MKMRETAALSAWLGLVACGRSVADPGTGGAHSTTSTTSSPSSSSSGVPGCVPGQQIACACLGGSTGVQVCNAEGTAYGPCDCGTGGMPPTPCTPSTTAPCYEGPAGTQGVGTCKGGTKVCSADGSGYGPCSGQVLPGVDLCSTPEDEDCSGAGSPCVADATWCHAYPVPGYSNIFGVATDAADDVVFGTVLQGADLGSGPVSGPAVIKYDSKGNVLWARVLPVEPSALAAGADGSVVVAGSFGGTADFGTGLFACPGAGYCPFLARLAADGTTTFARALIGPSSTGGYPQVLAVDGAGNIAIGGFFKDSFDCGAGPINPTSSQDAFVAKLSPGGACQWSKGGGALNTAAISSISFDPAGDLVLSGYFAVGLSFGGPPVTTSSGFAYYLAKLGSSGTLTYLKGFPAGTSSNMVRTAVGPQGQIAMAGVFAGTLDLGGGPLTATAAGDVFVARFDAAGDHLWSHAYGSGNPENVTGVAVDPGGKQWVAGYFQDLADLGSGALHSAGSSDIFLAGYAAGGAPIVSHAYGSAGDEYAHHLTANSVGTPIIAGVFNGSIDVGQGPIVASGQSVFVCQIAQ